MSNEKEKASSILNQVLTTSFSEQTWASLDSKYRSNLSIIVDNACKGNSRSVLAVVITLILKKILSPKQDIRLHQKNMNQGFSGRGLDQRAVTPFLRENKFPYMQAGSGWLTRSLEQNHPYTYDYPGVITPPDLKEAFLKVVNLVEEQKISAKVCLAYILHELLVWRERNASITLSKPTGRRIEDIVSCVQKHWQCDISGTARLPVLAVYAVYQCLISEVFKYKDCQLLELLSHTSADSKTERIGDIDIKSGDSTIESVEIKHNIAITAELIEQLREKIAGAGLKTFYILSTSENIPPDEMNKITNLLLDIRRNYGCQVIVNGVSCTIRYYLRLLLDIDMFVYKYVSLIEADTELVFDLKIKWNDIVDGIE